MRPSSSIARACRPVPSRITVSPPTLWMASSCLRQVHGSLVGRSQYPVTAYGVRMPVSKVPQGSVNALPVAEGDAFSVGELSAALRWSDGGSGRTMTTAATAAMIAAPSRTVSRRTFRSLPP
ncbi:hypothetical protein [Thermocatellispora tengchongensis]|uniref:hypothetical protein n=1 Tax=Thermocatellispora tengchongensis TaxID=1073253 RepID=UPI00362721B7